MGTLAAVVIETLEHKAISESSEVMHKLTANSCIALCSSTNAVSISSARTTKRFPSRCASTIQIVRLQGRELRPSPSSKRVC